MGTGKDANGQVCVKNWLSLFSRFQMCPEIRRSYLVTRTRIHVIYFFSFFYEGLGKLTTIGARQIYKFPELLVDFNVLNIRILSLDILLFNVFPIVPDF